MKVIALEGGRWASLDDLFEDLLPALGAPDWHGRNHAALIDSIGVGDINAIEPPYVLRVTGGKHMAPQVLEFLRDVRADIAERIQEVVGDGYEPRDVQIVLDIDS